MTIDELYQDTKLNYKLYLIAVRLAEIKEQDGRVVKKEIIESLLNKKGIPEKMPFFVELLPEDYWSN